MHHKINLYSIVLILSVLSGSFLLIQCSNGPSEKEQKSESVKEQKENTDEKSELQEIEDDFYIIVSGGDHEERKLDLSTSVMLPGWTHMNSSDITQAKVIGGYAEGSDFGTATLTLYFPGTSSGEHEFTGRGDFLRGNPGATLSSIEILGLPQMHASNGTITVESYPEEKGDWFKGSFDATFTDESSGTEYEIEGEFAVER